MLANQNLKHVYPNADCLVWSAMGINHPVRSMFLVTSINLALMWMQQKGKTSKLTKQKKSGKCEQAGKIHAYKFLAAIDKGYKSQIKNKFSFCLSQCFLFFATRNLHICRRWFNELAATVERVWIWWGRHLMRRRRRRRKTATATLPALDLRVIWQICKHLHKIRKSKTELNPINKYKKQLIVLWPISSK